MKEIPKEIIDYLGKKYDGTFAGKWCKDAAIFGYQLATESSPNSQSLIDRVKELEILAAEMKERRKSHAKKYQESVDSYQEQYCHGRIDECDFIIAKLSRMLKV